MARRVTHRLDDEFESRTLFLWATLGLVSYLRRYARAIAPIASDETPRLRRNARDGDEALHAMLGLVSASRTARAHWRALDKEPAPTARPRRPGRSSRGIERPRALLV